jgi:predicted transcriptional regulator
MTFVLSVRDVDGLLAKLRNFNSQVVTPGGEPVAVTVGPTRARAVLIKAPGGHFIELRQPDPLPADSARPAGNVIGSHIRVTIADTDATLRLYRDQLGLKPDVYEALREQKSLGYTTVLKLLQIMTAKGTVRRNEEQRAHVYEACQPAEETKRQLVGDVLHRVFEGSASELMIHALEGRRTSKKELDELRRLLDEYEGRTR